LTAGEKRWLIDGLDMNASAVLEVAADYGYGGTDAGEAADLLWNWGYSVEPLPAGMSRN